MPQIVSLLISFSLLCCSLATAATPNQDWKTLETQHFRVYFTPPYQEWAETTAYQLEDIRQHVQTDQSRTIDEKIDVLVFDPLNLANGSAIPLSHKPTIRLYATPPTSDSMISYMPNWQQLLVLHEYIHVVHLAQKSRNDYRRTAAKVWDLYDAVTIPGNRWVAEGYATLKESQMTGMGRIYSDKAEAFVRQLAREGAMPNYAQLSATEGTYRVGAYAYLIGSRFLRWIEKKYGEDKLNHVWTRWRAVKSRSFEEAFNGLYPVSVQKLYRRFVAEMTHETLSRDTHYQPKQTNEWLNNSYSASALTISPDSKRIALVESNKKSQVFINIYSTDENKKAKELFKKQQKAILEADPKDIPSVEPNLFKRKKEFTIEPLNSQALFDPQWIDNENLIYGSLTRDSDGNMHRDLFSWNMKTQGIKRLTHHANVRRFSLLPQQNSVVAEINRHGYSQLVELDLNNGQSTLISTKIFGTFYDMPRVSPDGQQLAFLQKQPNQLWQLKLAQKVSGSWQIDNSRTLPAPSNYQYLSYPQWDKKGNSLFYVAGIQGELSVYQLSLKENKLQKLTNGQHSVSWPTPFKENELLLLEEYSDGPDVYHLALTSSEPVTQVTLSAKPKLPTQLSRTVLPSYDPSKKIRSDIKNYGTGKQRPTFVLGSSFNQAAFELIELGVKSEDMLDRLEWQVNLSQSTENALQGWGGHLQWSGWPITLAIDVFDYEINTLEQEDQALNAIYDRQGVLLSASKGFIQNNSQFQLSGAIFSGETNQQDEDYWRLGWQHQWQYNHQSTQWYHYAKLDWLEGKTGLIDWRGTNGELLFGGKHWGIDWRVGGQWAKRLDVDASTPLLSLGGFESTLMQSKYHPNAQFAPSLPFYAQQGNDYQSYLIELPEMIGKLNLFFQNHQMDQSQELDIIGLRRSTRLDIGITGANDIQLDFGISQISSDITEDKVRLWGSLFYRW
ncbi:hypothetical protein [Pleionea sp. CnH1-48]|uniref:TolB family protein n=1 Tax=Pleionea sp. CnH1-48 TaxID=2954494 RepID=UPI002097E6CB|nr:hypothetical protein [Pleionea sp. CnH1-48]MCO7224706.1 hypothetical protein [Pleionea sp. CnH1-48]